MQERKPYELPCFKLEVVPSRVMKSPYFRNFEADQSVFILNMEQLKATQTQGDSQYLFSNRRTYEIQQILKEQVKRSLMIRHQTQQLKEDLKPFLNNVYYGRLKLVGNKIPGRKDKTCDSSSQSYRKKLELDLSKLEAERQLNRVSRQFPLSSRTESSNQRTNQFQSHSLIDDNSRQIKLLNLNLRVQNLPPPESINQSFFKNKIIMKLTMSSFKRNKVEFQDRSEILIDNKLPKITSPSHHQPACTIKKPGISPLRINHKPLIELLRTGNIRQKELHNKESLLFRPKVRMSFKVEDIKGWDTPHNLNDEEESEMTFYETKKLTLK